MTDYTDLARWLKAEGDAHFAGNVRDRRTVAAKMHEAADAIAALQAEVARLREQTTDAQGDEG